MTWVNRLFRAQRWEEAPPVAVEHRRVFPAGAFYRSELLIFIKKRMNKLTAIVYEYPNGTRTMISRDSKKRTLFHELQQKVLRYTLSHTIHVYEGKDDQRLVITLHLRENSKIHFQMNCTEVELMEAHHAFENK